MARPDYIYAAARVRSKELLCFSAATLEQLMACKTYEECLRTLNEKGWGNGEPNQTAESLLTEERDKTWSQLRELVEDVHAFDVALCANDYHNLKAAVKENCTENPPAGIFQTNCTVDPELIRNAVREGDFSKLPEDMAKTAAEALHTLRTTGDGQLCDVIVDRAALTATIEAAKREKCPLISFYAEHTVASANMKTAVRCCKTGKSRDFVLRALAPCDTLDCEKMADAVVEGMDSLFAYLAEAGYGEAVEALKVSASAFERWCDNRLMREIQPQKYHTSTIEPLFAWLLARENEIKTVRVILSGKRNALSDDAIRERLREMYV